MNELANLTINIEDFENPPTKVLLMYEAVHKLLENGQDANSLKVSDITKEAGIGKGTAYEYFTSKEEIIAKAMYFQMYNNVKKMLIVIYGEGDFKSKYYKILDYMWDNNMHANAFQTMIRVIKGTEDPRNVFFGFEKMGMDVEGYSGISQSMCIIDSAVKYFIDQAVAEELFNEPEEEFRKNAFCSQLLMYIFFLQDKNHNFDKKKIQDFVYEGMIKILNN